MRNVLRSPWQVAALVHALIHGIIAALFPLGLAVSSVPFTSDGAQSAATSPVIPLAHVAACVVLLAGLIRPKLRDLASVASCTVWFAYAAMLGISAWLRHPHLAMVGPVMATGFALFAVGLVRCWEHDDETG